MKKVNTRIEYATSEYYIYNVILIDLRGKERTFQGGVTLKRL